jgi:hypothetical protein
MGLEPATSGVTGHDSERYMDDDRFAMALVTSVFLFELFARAVGPVNVRLQWARRELRECLLCDSSGDAKPEPFTWEGLLHGIPY